MKRKRGTHARQSSSNDLVAPELEIPIIDELDVPEESPIVKGSEVYQAIKLGLSANESTGHMQEAEATGEETLGGHAPTPDQDIVEKLGEAAGIEFQDNQPLETHEEVWAKRDRRRWELDRRSADDASS